MAARPQPLGKAACISSPRRRTQRQGHQLERQRAARNHAAPKRADRHASVHGRRLDLFGHQGTCRGATPAITTAAIRTAAVKPQRFGVVKAVEPSRPRTAGSLHGSSV